ncbi:acyl-CoA N-acyltransferase [Xylaria palmicola]|nr:acyl-CoA N-acyltransferase [Xylaria palmicola]
MAPQKRKHPHDGAGSPPQDAPARRSTRQHPDAAAEPGHQLRSGRPRTNAAGDASAPEATGSTSQAKARASKPAASDAAVTTPRTRTTRHKVAIAPGPKAVAAAAVSLPSKENVRPSTPPQGRGRRASQTNQYREKANTPKPPGTPRSDRNIDKIVFGNTSFKSWYPSYYGKDVLGDVAANVGGGNAKMGGGKRDAPMLDRLYICPCCFKYAKEMTPWREHVQYCETKAFVPGTKIYTHPRRPKTVSRPYPKSASAPTTITTATTTSLSTSPTAGSTKGKGKTRRDLDHQPAAAGDVVNEGEWSVWEVDGEKDGLFCQNLSLFAKLFLDNKSVFFDVTGFNYFLLVYTPPPPPPTPLPLSETNQAPLTQPSSAGSEAPDIPVPAPSNAAEVPAPPSPSSPSSSPPPRPQIVGFFSKEKMSWDNNNLACILVFPPWQRKGLGTLLMGVSYEISRREGVLGGPEKPISELGRRGYRRFWAGEITRWLLGLELPGPSKQPAAESAPAPAPAGGARPARREKDKDKDRDGHGYGHGHGGQTGLVVNVERCARDTWIVAEDCLAVLREMGIVETAATAAERPGPPGDGREKDKDKDKDEQTRRSPRVRIDKAAVRKWALENGIDLTRACDPDGFVEGYAIRQDEDDGGEE